TGRRGQRLLRLPVNWTLLVKKGASLFMVMFILLGVIVAAALVVVGVLFFMLSKEGQKREEEKAVPITDIKELKKDLSSSMFEQKDVTKNAPPPEVVPVYTPKVSLPLQEALAPTEDDKYKKRAAELEDELRTINLKAEGQSSEAKFLISALTKENEALKNQ